ncbi:MAG: hypothetical protein AB3N63_11180 [Puniceicoccaceae bacterium]
MKTSSTLKNSIFVLVIFGVVSAIAYGGRAPNIIYILADDLGYSDLSKYSAEASAHVQ